MYGSGRRLAAEFFGTFGVVFFSAGAICANGFLRSTNRPGFGSLGIAVNYGLAFGAMIAATTFISPIPGSRRTGFCGHLNPAITLGFWGTRRLGTFDALGFCAAQLLGATTAAFLLRAIVPEEVWRSVALGTPDLAAGFTRTPAMLIEGVASFFLVFVFFATSIETAPIPSADTVAGASRGLTSLVAQTAPSGSMRAVSAISCGFIVTAGALLDGPFTGGSINPARAFGPAFASHHWTNSGVYWIGPLGGGVLAAFIYDAVFLRFAPSTRATAPF